MASATRLPARKRGEGGVEARRTDDRIHHDGCVGMSRGLYQDLGTGRPLRILARARESGVARVPLFRDLGRELIPIATRR